MGRIIRYVKMVCAGSVAHKVLKWDFYYDAIYETLRKLYHSMYYPFFHYCRIVKTIQQFCHKILAREIFMCTLIYDIYTIKIYIVLR